MYICLLASYNIVKMTFIHIADLHANKARLTECSKVLEHLYDFINEREDKPVLLISGDFWDSAIQNTENSGFTEYVNLVKRITTITNVIFITGTPYHEPNGSLNVFSNIGASVYTKNTFRDYGDFELVAIPEPRRGDYIASSTEETTKNIKEALEKFILSLPEKTKPRIVMYHGEIMGAVYQNNMVASSPIALSKKLLQSTKADYIACGHIHLPQAPFENCYYSGSCYPVNAGEHHDASFNLVTIDGDSVSVERHSFGFPINITETVPYADIDKFMKRDFSNVKLTVKLSLEKLLKKSFNQQELEQKIKEKTGALSVRIQYVFKQETNVRSEQLVNERSISDKFKIYCDINDIKISDETMNKLADIQDHLLIENFIPCDTFELQSLELRGSIGIRDGMGLEEFNIDFTKYSNGVLGLCGVCGSGKSTILENCHPFPQMLTRKGILKEHFCLKDSYRKITYKTSNGSLLRISMFIDGTENSVTTKYYVETNDGSGWKPNRSVDGSSDSYKEWVHNTFGDVDMFLRTSFYANKAIRGLPDLADATKTDKMILFSTLAGTDYLTVVSDIAKTRAKEAEDSIKDIKKDMKNYDELKQTYDHCNNVIAESSEVIEKEEKQLEQDATDLEELERKQEEFLQAVGSANYLRREVVNKRNELTELVKSINETKNNIEEFERQLDNKEFYQNQINWWDNSIEQEDELRKEKDSVNENIKQISFKKTEYQTQINKLLAQQGDFREKLTSLKGEEKLLNKSINKINDICPVCGEKLSDHKKEELERDNKITEEKIKENLDNQKSIEGEIESIVSDTQDVKKSLSELDEGVSELQNSLENINSDLTQINSYRETVDIEKAKFIVNEVAPLLEKNSALLQEQYKQQHELEETISKMDKELEEIPQDFSDKIKRLKNGMEDSRTNLANAKAEKEQASKELLTISDKLDQLKEIDKQLKQYNEDFRDYTIIQKAFSHTGIQAIELDSAAPEISKVANDILATTYGDRFTIKFETQRDSKGGKKIEDFVIDVFDSKTGRKKRLDLLSSGESVWIKQALYYAFSVVRSRRSGFCFRTRFLDESDGALDSMARIKYLNMIESAHKACNATLTILVTHSQEIKDILEQKLELA